MNRITTMLATLAVVLSACGSNLPTTTSSASAAPPTFVVSRAQFDQAFPNRNPFYTYDGFIAAFPGFGSAREAAEFLGNVDHETGGLRQVVESNTAAYGSYCDLDQRYGCPAGRDAYYGRGPVQLSWNYNYKAAGEALGIDLLNDPSIIARDPTVAWRTTAWFWDTRVPHDADFGATIRAFNGEQECDGGNPGQVQSRVNAYLRMTALLGVSPGENLSC